MQQVDPSLIPHHVAIIMDGNRRWARQHRYLPEEGHVAGAETLSRVVRFAINCGIRILTVYAFSTENWKRSALEVELFQKLFYRYLNNKKGELKEEGVKLSVIGNLAPFSKKLIEKIAEVKAYTQNGSKLDLVLALNYGGRDEICRAITRMFEEFKKGERTSATISEQDFSQYLDTADWPDPDLMIRTSGEYRLSNFLLWQSSYTELYTTQVYWPEFGEKDLREAIAIYQERSRRLGR